MASVPFTLTANQTLTNSAVTGNGKFEIYNSGPQNNSGDYEALRVILEYGSLTPDPENFDTGFSLTAVIEAEEGNNSGLWFPLARQFDVLRSETQGARQVFTVAPNIFNFDEGIPIDDWDGNQVTTRNQKVQSRLGDTWRVRIELNESKYGTSDAFTSCTVNVYGDRYNA